MAPKGSRPLLWAVRAVALLAFGALSLTGEIGPVYLSLAWAAWGASVWFDSRPDLQEPLRHYETLAVAGLITMFLVDFLPLHQTVFVSVTHFLILFQILKLVGLKERKDCFQIFLFGFFQILASCTLSVDAWHAVVLLLFIPSAAFALFWHHVERENELHNASLPLSSRSAYRRMSLGIAAGSLPLVLALTIGVFVVFPRLTLNASLPGFSNNHIGYTDQVNLAQSGVLENQNVAVLWLAFPSDSDRRRWDGYLRGSTLDQFDGRQWTPRRSGRSQTLFPDVNGVFVVDSQLQHGRWLRQGVTLVDTSATTIFVAGTPQQVIAPLPSLQREASGALRWTTRWQRPLRYQVLSSVSDGSTEISGEISEELHSDLLLPGVPLARVAGLARQVGGNGSDLARAQAIESFLREKYQYSLDLGAGGSSNPVEEFLFERKRGPCGHFASAMAVMLRLENIPARLVSGYLRGEWNEPAQQYLVRERDAHAWVEGYIPGAGWVRFDPSPRQVAAPGPNRRWQNFRQYLDYLGLKWNRLVIQYDLYSQLRAFEHLRNSSGKLNSGIAGWFSRRSHRQDSRPGSENPTGPSHSFPLRGVLVATAAATAYWFASRKRSLRRSNPTVVQYERFLRTMARVGAMKAPHETGWEFAQRAAASHPEHKQVVWEATRRYYKIRFGGRS